MPLRGWVEKLTGLGHMQTLTTGTLKKVLTASAVGPSWTQSRAVNGMLMQVTPPSINAFGAMTSAGPLLPCTPMSFFSLNLSASADTLP